MIYVKENRVQFEGTKSDLMAELTILMRGFKDKEVFTKEDLTKIVEIAFMNEEDLRKSVMEELEKLLFGDGGKDK